jgi:hypothetical protein
MQCSIQSVIGASQGDAPPGDISARDDNARPEDQNDPPIAGQEVLLVLSEREAGVPDYPRGGSSTAERRRLLQVFSPWSHGITLTFPEHIEFVNSLERYRPIVP